MKLSIIIPAYNAEKFIEKTVEELLINFPEGEIIVINDGSIDKTLEKLQTFNNKITIINHPKNQGKGFAIQNGFKQATGDIIIFTDADLPYGIDNIKDMYNCLKETDNEIMIAYRKTFRENFFRHITHIGINMIIQVLFWFNVYDTQCGLKGFKKTFIDKVKDKLISKNFTIDIELLHLAKIHNQKMAKLLVSSRNINKDSTIKIKDIIVMLLEILKIRFDKNNVLKNKIIKIVKSPWFISALILLLLYIFLLAQIPWNLIFKDTMISGGDTGSHNYIVYKLKNIFPVIKTWTHDWYGGFPFLYFYPSLMFIISVLLSFVMKLNIAFKITTLLGTLIMPLCVFLGLRFMGYKKHIPEIGALGSILFLFLEVFNIYGGNIPSTLAGEFSYSFSFALFFLFIGLLSKGVDENKYIVPNVIILAIMALAHPFPVISATIYGGILIFLGKNWKKRFGYIMKVFFMAFCITAFWSIPFLYYKSYTSMMNWYQTIKLNEIFPKFLILFQVGAILGIFFSIIQKNIKIFNFLAILITNFILFMLINNSPIYNTRFLPFVIMSYILIGAIGIGETLDGLFLNKKAAKAIAVIILMGLTLSFINPKTILGKNTKRKSAVEYIPLWMEWNYKGFEDKEIYRNTAIPLFIYLKNLPYGKIMWEYRPEYDEFGTPRFLENLPVLTNKPTFEGLLIESSIFGPFHFINQTETTQSPTSAIAGFEYPPFDFKKGVEHLKLSNARYFVAYTENIKILAQQNMTWLKDIGNFSVYELPKNDVIDIFSDFTMIKKEKEWIKTAIDWYKNGDLKEPIVFYTNQQQKDILNRIDDSKTTNKVEILNLTDNEIIFKTNDLNKLHMIKVSYFPTWKVKGGDGPFLMSPSFIGVIPRQNIVSIKFENGLIDNIAYFLTYASLAIVVIKIIRPKSIKFL